MNKKETIQALETKWGVQAAYLGTPSFAYEIKTDTQTLIIDRHGVIRDLQGHELSIVELLSAEPAVAAAPAEKVSLDIDGYTVKFPLADHTGSSLDGVTAPHMVLSRE
jgi:hypothetical protein